MFNSDMTCQLTLVFEYLQNQLKLLWKKYSQFKLPYRRMCSFRYRSRSALVFGAPIAHAVLHSLMHTIHK